MKRQAGWRHPAGTDRAAEERPLCACAQPGRASVLVQSPAIRRVGNVQRRPAERKAYPTCARRPAYCLAK